MNKITLPTPIGQVHTFDICSDRFGTNYERTNDGLISFVFDTVTAGNTRDDGSTTIGNLTARFNTVAQLLFSRVFTVVDHTTEYWYELCVIDSYTTPIATVWVNYHTGEINCMVSQDRYSPTTARHLSIISMTCRDKGISVFEGRDPQVFRYSHSYSTTELFVLMHDANRWFRDCASTNKRLTTYHSGCKSLLADIDRLIKDTIPEPKLRTLEVFDETHNHDVDMLITLCKGVLKMDTAKEARALVNGVIALSGHQNLFN